MHFGKDAVLPAEALGTKPPLVSIVTPSFQQGRFLRRTIDSVLGQSYPHIEYVVMDGGSTDESVSILKSYGDRFRWVSAADRGQTDAINKGFAQTRGQIRAYLNSDDVLLSDSVATAVGYFSKNPDWDLIYGGAYNIDENDVVLGQYPTAAFTHEGLVQTCCICQPASFWRTSLAKRVGPLDDELHFAMDYEYWLRVAGAGGRIVHVPEVLGCNRQYPQTKTWSARLKVFAEIFEVSRRHVGQAGFGHFLACWHYRLHERATGWPRWLRWLPGAEWALAWIHSRWHRQYGSPWGFTKEMCASVGRRLRLASRSPGLEVTRRLPHP